MGKKSKSKTTAFICCGDSDRPGMQLCAAIVVFAASLPHAIVGHSVGSFHTEHQVLDEGHLHKETAV